MLIKCNAADHLYLIDDDPVRAKLFEDNSVRFEDPFHVYAEVNDETGEKNVKNYMGHLVRYCAPTQYGHTRKDTERN